MRRLSMPPYFVALIALGGLALSGCTPGFMSISENSNSSVVATTMGELVFDRTSLPIESNSKVTLSGKCFSKRLVEITATDMPVPMQLNCPETEQFSFDIDLYGADGLKTIKISSTDATSAVWMDSVSITKDATPPSVILVSVLCTLQDRSVSGTCESDQPVSVTGDLASSSPVECINGTFRTAVNIMTAGTGVKNFTVAQSDRLGNRAIIRGTCTVPAPTPVPTPVPTATPRPTATPMPTATPRPTATPPGATPSPTPRPTATPMPTATPRPTATPAPTATPTPPVVTIVQPTNSKIVGTSVDVTGGCTNGIPVVLYGTGVSANVTTPCSMGLYTGKVNLTSGDGAKEVRAGQTNSAGLYASALVTVIKDTTAPALTITGPASGSTFETGLTLQGACENGTSVIVSGSGTASAVSGPCSMQSYSIAVVFSAGDGTKTLTAEQADAAGNKASVSRSFTKAPATVNGLALYQTNCQGCHGVIDSSLKRNRTSAQIKAAITSVPTMSAVPTLAALTTAQIDAIAAALSTSSGPTTPPTTTADQYFATANPALYQLSRKYFPSDDSTLPPKRIFRLTRNQIDITTQNLLPLAFKNSITKTMAKDPLQINYEYADIINFNSSNFTPLKLWTDDLAAQVRANPTSVINCTAAGNSVTCLQTQARAFLLKAFRGDISDVNIARFTKFLTDGVAAVGITDATADFVDVVLSSPIYLFRDETKVSTAGLLPPAEILQNLTYTLADAPPEKLNLSSLNAATLVQSTTSIKSTADTIIGTAEARQKLMQFFARWLEVKDPGEFTISTVDFPQFTPAIESAVVAETKQFLNFHLTKAAPKLKDITQSTESFVSQSIASLYDINATNLTGLTPVKLDPTKRLGIFSQPAVIASHSGPTSTRLVKRGVFWVRKVMCMEMGPPPAGTNTTLPPPTNATERQVIESVTNQSTCLGCHSVINPLGFFQENYDPIGKWRTLDNGLPINASISTNILDEGPVNTDQPVEALKSFTSSAMFKQCFVRQLFRFYMGRNETPADHAILREMFMYFSDGDQQDILTLIKILSGSKVMTQRAP